MSVSTLRSRLWSASSWEGIAWATWIGLLLVVSVRTLLYPNERTVYPIWSSSSRLWWSGDELYSPYRPNSVQGGFRYLPTFAILTSPFAVFPDGIGGALWRCCCAAGLAVAAGAWIRRVIPVRLPRSQVAILALFMLPLSVQSLANGQANVPVIALLLGAVAAVRARRWNWASLLVGLAFACKVYPLALGLLLVVLYPRQLGWRLPLMILALLALPFMTQSPAYVLDQYGKWVHAIANDDRSEISWNVMYRDLWLLLRLVRAPIDHATYQVIEVLSGAGLAVLCWYRQRRGWSEGQLLTAVLALATTWMLLLGPATESSTFALLAPSLAWCLVEVIRNPGWSPRRGLLFGSSSLFLVAVAAGAFPSATRMHALGAHPLATLLFLLYLLSEPRVDSFDLDEGRLRLAM